MSNNTTAYWDLDGTSLNQWGWSVKSIGDGLALPPMFGENITVANRPGVRHIDKVPGPRSLALAMWMTGTDPATGINSSVHSNAMIWNKNWDTIRGMVYSDTGSQKVLTRRWWKVEASTKTLISASALVELTGVVQPTMTSRDRCDFVLEFLMADPYFYGTTSTTTWSSPGSKTITNAGDATVWHSNFTLTLQGPASSPKVQNSTTGVWVQYGSTISGGETVTINLADFTAISSTQGNVVKHITHGGARPWLTLRKGANTVSLSSGHGTLSYNTPYV